MLVRVPRIVGERGHGLPQMPRLRPAVHPVPPDGIARDRVPPRGAARAARVIPRPPRSPVGVPVDRHRTVGPAQLIRVCPGQGESGRPLFGDGKAEHLRVAEHLLQQLQAEELVAGGVLEDHAFRADVERQLLGQPPHRHPGIAIGVREGGKGQAQPQQSDVLHDAVVGGIDEVLRGGEDLSAARRELQDGCRDGGIEVGPLPVHGPEVGEDVHAVRGRVLLPQEPLRQPRLRLVAPERKDHRLRP